MQITDEAKTILQKMLEEEKKNGISFFTQGQGCHTKLCMDFITVSDGNQINGLYVDMSEDTARLLENIILDAQDNTLMIRSTVQASGCGGCSGCGGSCGDDCGCEGGCC